MYPGDDYVDTFVKAIQAAVVPSYAESEKMVDPPIIAIRLGNEIFIKGVITGTVGVTYDLPILRNNKYALCSVGFNVSEVTPYDAKTILEIGSYRDTGDIPISMSLDKGMYTTNPSGVAGIGQNTIATNIMK